MDLASQSVSILAPSVRLVSGETGDELRKDEQKIPVDPLFFHHL